MAVAPSDPITFSTMATKPIGRKRAAADMLNKGVAKLTIHK